MPSTWGKREMDGRLIVPAETCEEIGPGLGEAAVLEIVDGELRIRPLSQNIEQVQTVFGRHVPEGVALADELIADAGASGRLSSCPWVLGIQHRATLTGRVLGRTTIA